MFETAVFVEPAGVCSYSRLYKVGDKSKGTEAEDCHAVLWARSAKLTKLVQDKDILQFILSCICDVKVLIVDER